LQFLFLRGGGVKTRKTTFLSLLISFLFTTTIFAGTIQLPQTGQTKCYNSTGAEIACAGTGQDGEIRVGVAWPNPRFTIGTGTESDCVTDNLTGLMWPRNGNLPNGTRVWNAAIDFANDLTLCGYSDWRLPNVNELESLVNADVPGTATWLTTQGFINMQSSFYWSSTNYAGGTNDVWIVDIGNGLVGATIRIATFVYAWPVRSGSFDAPADLWETGQKTSYRIGDDGDLEMGIAWPNPRFTVNEDCVTDNLTGLMWTKDANLAGRMTWNSAIDYANNLTLCGYSDWRLPNRKELFSLIDCSNFSPALPTGHPYTNVQADNYWSSSTNWLYTDSSAWLATWWGGVASGIKSCNCYYVWPVRAGQVGSFGDLVISPSSQNFGSINVGTTSSPQTFTISNTGTANLVIGTISITSTNASEFSKQNDNCSGQTIVPLGSCTLKAVFKPTSYGSKSANLSIPSNDPDQPTLDVPLQGTGGPVGNSTIGGWVYNKTNGILIAGVSVQIGTYTDPDGKYTISDIPAGNYIAAVSKSGYAASYETVSIPPASTVMKDFFLYPLSGTIQINSISSKYTGHVFYLNGTSHNVDFTANIDWAVHPLRKRRILRLCLVSLLCLVLEE